ncbi:MAG: hypothetical protein JXA71_04075, partial [Chitinispirillaceae bacterium]|nr:hypothetical protein [Chitinispirillaceae bacterium]
AEQEKGVVDRFGPLPESVSALLLLVRLKFAARNAGMCRVAISDDGLLSLTFEGEAGIVRTRIMSFLQAHGRQFEVEAQEQQTVLKTRLSSGSRIERIKEALSVSRGER